MTPHELTAAKEKMTRAYRVAFDSDPFDTALKLIELSAERVCNGDAFEWHEIDGNRVLKFAQDDEKGQLSEALQDDILSDDASEELEIIENVRQNRDMSIARLTENQQKFCRYYAQGLAAGRAYMLSGFKVNTQHAADVSASRMLKRPAIQGYVRKLREVFFKENAIGLAETQSMIADMIRMKGSDVKEDSPFVAVTVNPDGTKTITGPKPSDKLKALETNAKLEGWLKEEKVSVGLSLNMLGDRLKILDGRVITEDDARSLESSSQ